ncbi:glycoside hydrolase family 1 protein [Candidatus Omnitrophota bacterium]
MTNFPKDFLWGAATSSHQVEGNNIDNDWWQWEQTGHAHEPSLEACNHYNLYESDFDIARSLHHNAHRLSIEWSRIEPKKDQWNRNALEHYRKVIRALRARNIEPLITLHHFANPLWLSQEGGWLNEKTPFYFERFVEKVIAALGSEVRYWVTINEPMVLAYHSYILGIWPPERKSFNECHKVIKNLIDAHKRAYLKIHDIYARNSWRRPIVGIAKNLQWFTPCNHFPYFFNMVPVILRDTIYNDYFLRKTRGSFDFIGVNYYARGIVHFSLKNNSGLLGEDCNALHQHSKNLNSLGWIIAPQGLLRMLLKLKPYKVPLIITENGICTHDDTLRWKYIWGHLQQIKRALDLHIPIQGYLYWSLLDNFEWAHGFAPRFGLVEIDYHTLTRTVRLSALHYSQFIEEALQ